MLTLYLVELFGKGLVVRENYLYSVCYRLGLGGGAFLKGVCQWKWALRFEKPMQDSVSLTLLLSLSLCLMPIGQI